MPKPKNGASIFLLGIELSGCLLGAGQPLHAQQEPGTVARAMAELPRLELGVQAADIRTGCIGRTGCTQPSAALGIGGSFHLAPRLSIVGSWADTPTAASIQTNQAGGHESELLAGLRGELRARKFGYFADAQAGYLRWSNLILGAADTRTAITFTQGSSTRAVVQFGAGAEYSPAERIHVRGEVAGLVQDTGGQWRTYLQPSVGAYYGFGRPIAWTAPRYTPRESHRFLDLKDVALLAVGELGTTSDTVTTYEFIQRGYMEGDPVVRPLVKYGLPGQLALQGLEVALEIAGMYGFHRLHQHWAERAVPLGAGTAHGILAYQNTKDYSRSRNADGSLR